MLTFLHFLGILALAALCFVGAVVLATVIIFAMLWTSRPGARK